MGNEPMDKPIAGQPAGPPEGARNTVGATPEGDFTLSELLQAYRSNFDPEGRQVRPAEEEK